MKTVHIIFTEIKDQFRSAGIETPDLDARLLVQAALNISHEDLIANPQAPVTETGQKKLQEMTRRRLHHEPVSRILGHRAFWKSEFKISADTLDPRADSETLVEAVLKHADKKKLLRVLDFGTGTGCLLLSILQDLPQASGVGVDISPGAVGIAKQNASDLQLTDRASFVASDWNDLKPQTFDIVISNPPYIAEAEMAALSPEVTQYDPRSALVAGKDGLECYRNLARLIPNFLAPKGLIFLEIGSTQAESVKGILATHGYRVIQIVSDLAGHNRCIIATADNSG